MLNIKIVCVGNLKETWWRDASAEYQKRLSRFCRISITELPESTPEKEKTLILKNLSGYVFALCVEGKQMPSENLSEAIDKLSMNYSDISFVIGSSTGLDEEVKKKADCMLSFSQMTFPHQLMRIILLEQIYRAFTISNHITYHK